MNVCFFYDPTVGRWLAVDKATLRLWCLTTAGWKEVS